MPKPIYKHGPKQLGKAGVLALRDLYTFTKRFDRPLAVGLSSWSANGTDNLNIGSGFDDTFKGVLTAGSGSNSIGVEGLTCTTGATSANDFIVAPHTVAATSILGTAGAISLNNGYDILIRWVMKTGSSIASVEYGLGAMNTPESTTSASADHDGAFFRYNPSNSPYWQFVVNRSGTSTVLTLPTAGEVAASTRYSLGAYLYSYDNTVGVMVNNVEIARTTAAVRSLADDGISAVDLFPTAYVETKTSAAKSFVLSAVNVSIDYLT